MSFILVPRRGEDLQIDAWNWRPTLALLYRASLLTNEQHVRLGANGCGGEVDEALALRIAVTLDQTLGKMKAGDRLLADLTATDQPKQVAKFSPGMDPESIDANNLYSTTFEWLASFRDFCLSSGGFKVL